jgi:hypothetical protein
VIWGRIPETGLREVREVRAGKNRVRGVRIPTAVRCVIQSAMVENKSPRAHVQSAIPISFLPSSSTEDAPRRNTKEARREEGTCYITWFYLTLDAG